MAQIRLSRFRDASEPASADQSALRWQEGGKTLAVAAPGAVTPEGQLAWRGTLGRGRPFEAEWQAVLTDDDDAVVAARPPACPAAADRTGRGPGPAPG